MNSSRSKWTFQPKLFAAAMAVLFVITVGCLLVLVGCVTRATSTTASSDVRAYQSQLERPDWLTEMSDAEIEDLVERSLRTPISFYGLVIDENGEPIKDATVQFAVFDHALDPFEFPYVGWTALDPVKSDGKGRFSLAERKGTALYVRVLKEGYKSIDNSKRHVRYAERTRYLNDFPLPTQAEPMVFSLEEGLPLEDYFAVNSGAVLIPRDGSEIEYNLEKVNPYGVPSGEGDLAIACDKGPVNDQGQWDWSCRVRMVEGSGVQLRTNLVLDQAPIDGYQQVLEFGRKAGEPGWDHRDEKYLYALLRDGKFYGHLVLKIRTDGDFFFDIDGLVNITGDRRLESLFATDDRFAGAQTATAR